MGLRVAMFIVDWVCTFNIKLVKVGSQDVMKL